MKFQIYDKVQFTEKAQRSFEDLYPTPIRDWYRIYKIIEISYKSPSLTTVKLDDSTHWDTFWLKFVDDGALIIE